ncbi:MAG: tetratricopeptide repeat protein [Spirochaetota bacterium]|nr:tetratricopeptide repeat protein [Spirochaetota bacterium]
MVYSVPSEIVTIYNNALDYSNKGDINNAISEYIKAINAYPEFIEAYNNIGEIYSRQGESDKAISVYEKALKIDRNYKVLLNLGVEYYNAQKLNIALNFFTESISIKPDFLEGNYYSGLAFFNLKEISPAEKYFSKVIDLNRNHLNANYLLSYIYYDWKDYTKTLRCLDNIKHIADDKVFLNKYYGFCYYHLGSFEKAVDFLTMAVESSPKYIVFKDYLQKLTYQDKIKEIGDIDAEIKSMEENMVKTKPTIRDCTYLSTLYIYKGDNRKAEEILLAFKEKEGIS